MNFLKTVGNSIHSPQFYSKVPKKTFKQSLGYFLLLSLALTTIYLLTLIPSLLIQAPKEVKDFSNNLINCYPEDLEVKVTNGKVSVNKEEPYFISSCEGGGYLGVIDTKTPFSPDKFEQYRVGLWVTKDSVVYKKSDLETRTYSLSEVDLTVNKTMIDSQYQKFSPFLKFAGPILFLLAFLGTYLSYIFRLVHVAFIALLIWILSKIFKKELSYPESYKVGLFAISLGLIVNLLVGLTSRWTNFYGFPFMVTVLTLAVVFVNLFQSKKST